MSRLAMDVVDCGLDLSKDPKFTEAVAHKVYYGPVYFRRESEPYMTLSLAGTRKDAGVSIAEVNLKLIWDVVSQIKVGEHGHAYVVGPQGRLIAHPDISLVLRNTDMSRLLQVQAAQAGGSAVDPESLQGTRNIQGQEVLTASAPIAPLGWTMFVELPVEEAYASLYLALQRLALVLAAASIFAVLAGIFLARRMVGPIQALRAGAERIGSGDFAQRISINTGDELEGLANQFNDMGARLQESYADLEKKVEQRTAELSESLEQQTATAEILSSISGSLTDTKPVFDAIVRNLLRLFSTRFAVVQTLNDGMVEMPAVDGEPGFERLIDRYPRPLADDTVGGLAMLSKHAVQFFPVLGNPAAPPTTQQFARDFGFNAVIFTPMLLGEKVVGAIGVARHEFGRLRRKANRADRFLRQSGRDRHREHAPPQGITPAHRRFERIPAAADRDRRRAESHQPLGVRPQIGADDPDRIGAGAMRRIAWHHLPARRRGDAAAGRIRLHASFHRFHACQSDPGEPGHHYRPGLHGRQACPYSGCAARRRI